MNERNLTHDYHFNMTIKYEKFKLQKAKFKSVRKRDKYLHN